MTQIRSITPNVDANQKRQVWSAALIRWFLFAVGGGIFLLALLFIYWALEKNWTDLKEIDFKSIGWRWLALGAFGYGASLITSSLAWSCVLSAINQKTSLRYTLPIGLISQSAKYLPGNWGHYLGRAVLAKRFSITLKTSGLSTVLELGLAVTASFLVVSFYSIYDFSIVNHLMIKIHPFIGGMKEEIAILILVFFGSYSTQ